jgi:3-oxoacyl-[acyl-carrier-protein] synthase II
VDRVGQFTILASELALRDAGVRVSRDNAERIGIVAGTSNGPVHSCKTFHREVALQCPQKVNPALFPNTVLNAGVGLAAINLRVRGPNIALSIGQASGLSAVCQGYELVRTGAADMMIAGGVEELEPSLFEAFAVARRISPYVRNRFSSNNPFSHNGDHPHEISCPFDRRRTGMVLGEGAGFVVLESLESALSRSARIYAEMTGYHSCADRPVEAGWDPSGEGVERAMSTALEMASLPPSAIGYVGAAAMSHPTHDAIEARAIDRLFGNHGVPVSALSSLVGVSAATGPFTIGAALLGMGCDFLPAGVNFVDRDPQCDLDLVSGNPRGGHFSATLINSASLCGTNVSVVFTLLDSAMHPQ